MNEVALFEDAYDCIFAGTPFSCHKNLVCAVLNKRAKLLFSASSLMQVGILTGSVLLGAGPIIGFSLGCGCAIYYAFASAAFGILFIIPVMLFAALLPIGPCGVLELIIGLIWPASLFCNWPLWTQGLMVPMIVVFVARHIWMAYAWPRARETLLREKDTFRKMWVGLQVMIGTKSTREKYVFDLKKADAEQNMKNRLEELAHGEGYGSSFQMMMTDAVIMDKSLISQPPSVQSRVLAQLHGWPDFDTMYRSYKEPLHQTSSGT